MLEDIRDHDARPSVEEADWLASDAVALMVRSLMLAGFAILIGISASLIVNVDSLRPAAATTAQR
jgi:hypothetical protein